MAAGTFEEEEARVLAWLLARPEVGAAVDRALGGCEDQALPELVRIVRGLLGEDGAGGCGGEAADRQEPAGPGGADGPAAAKRPKRAVAKRLRAEPSQTTAPRPAFGDAELEPPVPLYWKIDLPEVSKILAHQGLLPASFVPVENPHTTLIYLGSQADDKRVALRNGISVEHLRAMREALEALQGEEFEVRMTEIVVEENVAFAVVSLPPIVPCSNKVPHVTLGTKLGVPPVYANQVVDEMKAGRREGITSIPLPAPRPIRGRLMLEYSGCPVGRSIAAVGGPS